MQSLVALPDRLPPLAKLFAQMYDPQSGGYIAPPRHQTKMFDEKDLVEWQEKYMSSPQYDSIELEVALFIYSLARMTNAKRVLETGCSRGFSTSFLASAVADNNGHSVVSIDVDSLFHLWEGSDVAPLIKFMNGSSTNLIQQVRAALNGQMFDMLFLDSLHTYTHLMAEIMLYEKHLKIGGLIVLHDTIYYDCLGPVALQLSENPRFEVITLPSPRSHSNGSRCPGVTVATKISNNAEQYPLQISQRYVEWTTAVLQSDKYLNRTTRSEPMLDVLRREVQGS